MIELIFRPCLPIRDKMSNDLDFDKVSSFRSGDTSSLLLSAATSISVPYIVFEAGNSGLAAGIVSGLESLRSSLPLL